MHSGVEISTEYANHASLHWPLCSSETAQTANLVLRFIKQKYIAKPLRFTFEHQSRRPHLWIIRALGASEAIDVGSMLGYKNEEVEVLLNEFGLALSPNRVLCLLESDFREFLSPLGKGK